jgi:hypothetical protein
MVGAHRRGHADEDRGLHEGAGAIDPPATGDRDGALVEGVEDLGICCRPASGPG